MGGIEPPLPSLLRRRLETLGLAAGAALARDSPSCQERWLHIIQSHQQFTGKCMVHGVVIERQDSVPLEGHQRGQIRNKQIRPHLVRRTVGHGEDGGVASQVRAL